MRKIFLLFTLLCALALMGTASALEAGDARTVIGADLTDEQISSVYDIFGIARGSVTELRMGIEEEKEYLGDILAPEQIGQRSISCIYIKILPEGCGLDIRTENITWCTKEMYRSALTTAGITDAEVIVAAPWAVSGTGGIAGICKAYEDISGEKLDDASRQAGSEELVITAELAEKIGLSDAMSIIHDLKTLLSEKDDMSDEEILTEIRRLAAEHDVEISDQQAARLLKLCRSFDSISAEDLKEKVQKAQETVKRLTEAGEKASGFVATVKSIFRSIADFFGRLFKKFG